MLRRAGVTSPQPPGRYFRTDHLKHGLGQRSVRGAVVVLASQGVSFALQMASTVVLARLLAPADFGLLAMANAALGLVQVLKDGGLAQATVQREEISHEQISTLFWFNAALSAGLAVVMAGLAPVIAWFYGEPKLAWVVVVISCTFVLRGLAVQHMALLRRQMLFRRIGTIEVLSLAAGVLASLAIALVLRNYWALVAAPVVSSATALIGAWLACRWVPGLPRRGTGVRAMINFGGGISAITFINYLARNVDNILIGWWSGPRALGLYGKAYGLLSLPINQINHPLARVVVPALSRLTDDAPRYRRYYVSVLWGFSLLLMPFIGWMIGASDLIILGVLGDQWADAHEIFKCLAVGAVLQPTNSSAGWLFVSQARTSEMMRWGAFAAVTNIVAFAVGLPWGPIGVAAAYVTVIIARTPVLFWVVGRHGPVNRSAFVLPVATSTFCAAAAAGGTLLVREALPLASLWQELLLTLLVPLLVACLATSAMAPGRRLVREGLRITREKVKR